MKGGARIWRETDTGVMRAAPHIECPHSVSNMMIDNDDHCHDDDDDDDDDYV